MSMKKITEVDVAESINTSTTNLYQETDGEFQRIPFSTVKKEISQDVEISVDTSLTQSGSAADAAAVGERLDELEEKIEEAASNSGSQGVAFSSVILDDAAQLHFYDDDLVDVVDPADLSGLSGGGTSSGSKLTFAIYTASSTSVLDTSGTAPVEYKFTSYDSDTGTATGSGTMTIAVGGVTKANKSIAQGDNQTIDLWQYLSSGTNTIKLTVTDSYGASLTRSLTITVQSFTIEWSLGDTEKATSDLTVYITPTGTGTKTIYLYLDGELYSSDTVTTSGRRISKVVSGMSDGSHTLECYGEMTVNDEVVESDHLTCAIAYVSSSSTTPVVSAKISGSTFTQYTNITVLYRTINPSENPTDVSLLVNNSVVQTISVDQSEQTWTYRPTEAGELTLGVLCGTVMWSETITVTSIGSDIAEVTDGLELKIDPAVITTDLADYTYNGYTITLSDGFDLVNGGITTDSDGVQCIKVCRGDSMYIDYMPFKNDCKSTGKDMKIICKVENSSAYDTTAISCLSNSIGFEILANDAYLYSEQTKVRSQTCEGYKAELEFCIKPSADIRTMRWYESGMPSEGTFYASSDNFAQVSAVGITVGSADCDVYLYLIRAYSRDLTKEEILANFISDGADGEEILSRYNRNQIYDGSGAVSPDLTAACNPDLRTVTWHAGGVSEAKTQTFTGYTTHVLTNGGDAHNWVSYDNKFKIQGTSSVHYADAGANQDQDASASGFVFNDGSTSETYAMTDDSIPTYYFNHKINVASQEHVNNMCLSQWYHEHQPYVRPAREADSRVRDCVEGHMAVYFFHNTTNSSVEVGPYTVAADETIFYGLGNMNNSKKTTDVFAQNDDDDIIVIEQLNNTSDQTRGKSDDLTDEDFGGDYNFEFRYLSDTVTESEAKEMFQELLSFIVACDPDNVTGSTLSTVATYDGVTYTTDTLAYRKAKWKAEAADHMIMDSIYYHQVFTLVFSMVDNRAKNMFWGYNKTEGKWHLVFSYDHDTAMGNDNEGGLTLRYGYLDTDSIGTKDVFNAADSTVFEMNRLVFSSELEDMYITCENNGCFDLDAFADYCDEQQSYVCEALWLEDAERKDIDTYNSTGTTMYMDMMTGPKRLQRRKFLKYQEVFMASYHHGTANTSDQLTIRGYTPSSYAGVEPGHTLVITPYIDMYINFKSGSYLTSVRAYAGEATTIELGVATMNDTENYGYGCSMYTNIEGLASLYPGLVNLPCPKLLYADIGSSVDGYYNTNLTSLSLEACKILERINVEGCTALTQAMDLSSNQYVKEFYSRGSGVTGVVFAERGKLVTAMMNAVTSLTAKRLNNIETFTLEDASALATLIVEYCSLIDTYTLVKGSSALSRVRLIDVAWSVTVSAYSYIMGIADILGIDDDGNNVAGGILTGTCYINSINITKYNALVAAFPDVTFSYGSLLEEYTVNFYDGDGNLGNSQNVEQGGAAVDPVKAGYMATPTKESTTEYYYTFYGWDTSFNYVLGDMDIYPVFTQTAQTYTVTYAYTDGTVIKTYTTNAYGSVVYDGDDVEYEGYIFTGWSDSTDNITEDITVYAMFSAPTIPSEVKDLTEYDYAYTDVDGETSAYTFEEFYGIIKTGLASTYLPETTAVHMNLPNNTVTNDTDIVWNLHSYGHYELADGSGMSNADFYMTGVLVSGRQMNSSATNSGGWDSCEMRTWLNETFFPMLPQKWRQLVSKSITLANAGDQTTTITASEDWLRLMSTSEAGFDTTAVPYCNEVSADASEIAFSQYTSNNARIKKQYNGTGTAQNWWLRSADSGSTSYFRYVANGGYSGSFTATNSYSVCAGFSA